MKMVHGLNLRWLWQFQRQGVITTIMLKQPLVLLACLAALIYYIFARTGIMAMVVATLAGMNLIAYLWARSMALHVSARRQLHYTAFQVGDEFEEHIRLTNNSFLPVLWAEFHDHSNIPGYSVSSVRSTGGNSVIQWRAHTLCRQRGLFLLGPCELTTGDIFGIFQVQQQYLDRQEIVVYPPLAPLPPELLPHASATGSHQQLRQPLPAETIHANTTRPYVRGDPLRRLHWRSSARHNDLYVKVFEPESSSNTWLVPDFDASVQVGNGPDSSIETLVILTASLASQLLQEGLPVGLFTCTPEPHAVLPRTGRPHLWTILRALAPLQAAPGQPLRSTLSQSRALIPRRDLLVILTASLDLEWAHHLHMIHRQRSGGAGRVHTRVILLDPASFAPEESQSFSPSLSGNLLAQLASLNIHASLLRRDDIHPVLGAFGTLRRWEFKTLGTGGIYVRQSPRQVEVA
ncbi:MAG: DUF58 domain-containing protein [Anaerolineaceae bacterium]|jgi:uncharacterized protein (DUF58 family)